MKKGLILGAVMVCTPVHAELIEYQYSGEVLYTSTESGFISGEKVTGHFVVSNDVVAEDYYYRDQNTSASSFVEGASSHASVALSNDGGAEFRYSMADVGQGKTNFHLMSSQVDGWERVDLNITDVPGTFSSFPAAIDVSLAGRSDLFVQKANGHIVNIDITEISSTGEGSTCKQSSYRYEYRAVVNDNIPVAPGVNVGDIVTGELVFRADLPNPGSYDYEDATGGSFLTLQSALGNFSTQETGAPFNIHIAPHGLIDFGTFYGEPGIRLMLDQTSEAGPFSSALPTDLNLGDYGFARVFFHGPGGSGFEADIIELKNTSIDTCSYDFSLEVMAPVLNDKMPAHWSATITNKGEKKNSYSFWLEAEFPNGMKYPLGGGKGMSVKAGETAISKLFKFTPQNWQEDGLWKIRLNVFNRTTRDGPYTKSILLKKE